MRSLKTLVVVALAAAPQLALAELKVGYVDLKRALDEVSEGKAARDRLKLEVDKKKADLDAEQGKLRDDKAVLDKQGSMMSEEVRNQKFADLQKRLFEFTQKAEKTQMELAQKEQVELKKIFEKMDPIISGIAQREGLTLVFEKSDSGLVYAPASLDLTNELVRTYNDKYPAKTGAARAAPAREVAKEAPKAAAPAAAPADKK